MPCIQLHFRGVRLGEAARTSSFFLRRVTKLGMPVGQGKLWEGSMTPRCAPRRLQLVKWELFPDLGSRLGKQLGRRRQIRTLQKPSP